MDVPDSLNARFDLFRSSGRFFKHGAAELFAEESWVQVLLGQGFEAKADPVAQFVPVEEIVGFLNDIEDVIADVADTHAGSWGVRVAACRTASAKRVDGTDSDAHAQSGRGAPLAFAARPARSCPESHNGRELWRRRLSAD